MDDNELRHSLGDRKSNKGGDGSSHHRERGEVGERGRTGVRESFVFLQDRHHVGRDIGSEGNPSVTDPRPTQEMEKQVHRNARDLHQQQVTHQFYSSPPKTTPISPPFCSLRSPFPLSHSPSLLPPFSPSPLLKIREPGDHVGAENREQGLVDGASLRGGPNLLHGPTGHHNCRRSMLPSQLRYSRLLYQEIPSRPH